MEFPDLVEYVQSPSGRNVSCLAKYPNGQVIQVVIKECQMFLEPGVVLVKFMFPETKTAHNILTTVNAMECLAIDAISKDWEKWNLPDPSKIRIQRYLKSALGFSDPEGPYLILDLTHRVQNRLDNIGIGSGATVSFHLALQGIRRINDSIVLDWVPLDFKQLNIPPVTTVISPLEGCQLDDTYTIMEELPPSLDED